MCLQPSGNIFPQRRIRGISHHFTVCLRFIELYGRTTRDNCEGNNQSCYFFKSGSSQLSFVPPKLIRRYWVQQNCYSCSGDKTTAKKIKDFSMSIPLFCTRIIVEPDDALSISSAPDLFFLLVFLFFHFRFRIGFGLVTRSDCVSSLDSDYGVLSAACDAFNCR